MNKKFPFKILSANPYKTKDPEEVFRDLKNRSPKIQHLWSHQADILREYTKEEGSQDIAIELPTGAGKTLVGLLIAEYRRRKYNERVLYLCPTRQLAKQVGEAARDYGVLAHVLVGKQAEFVPKHFNDYNSAEAIAITTYSGLFNTSPRFNDPSTIIFDDAHAGDNYISRMWTLTVSRFENEILYKQIVELYSNELPNYLPPKLMKKYPTDVEKRGVDLLPLPLFLLRVNEFYKIMDEHTSEIKDDIYYRWQTIRDNLTACCAFFSWSEIVLRPLIPPSLTHGPFRKANQRIYMSATLGLGGELERITGISNIKRIPVPTGWDRESTGRRLIIFPERSFTVKEYKPWLSSFIRTKNRVLVLTPNGLIKDAFLDFMEEHSVKHTSVALKSLKK